jgi:hypothetical protein
MNFKTINEQLKNEWEEMKKGDKKNELESNNHQQSN